MYKVFITIIVLSYSSLFAHCDGCDTEHKTEVAVNVNTETNIDVNDTETSLDCDKSCLVGNVKYQGKVPNARPLKMDADPVCGASHTDKVLSQSFIVDADLNLKNVLVWLKNVKYEGNVTKDVAVIDQNGCLYSPHVLGVMKDQKVLIKNSDATLHNIHSMAKVNDQFNYAMPKVVKEKETTFNKVEEPFYIKCDVHPWMKSWVLVQDHPYFAVTDDKGNFIIKNIPTGTYEVIAWQEKFKMSRSITKTIEIKVDSGTVQDFLFIKPEKK